MTDDMSIAGKFSEVTSVSTGGFGSCPGCQPPEVTGGPVLNSRTYNIALETSSNTCLLHRNIRQAERILIANKKLNQCGTIHPISRPSDYLRQKLKQCTGGNSEGNAHEKDVFDFVSDCDTVSDPGSLEEQPITPPRTSGSRQSLESKSRRRRVPYSIQEIANLKKGVNQLGRFWVQILNTFEFHPSRTAVDLKDKYKRMMASGSQSFSPSSASSSSLSRKRGQPFSMVEERRLRRGVRQYGYHWKGILHAFKFANGRTAEELRSKWRSMQKSSNATYL